MSIELDPRFDGSHTGLARSLEALGKFDRARAEYEEGRRLLRLRCRTVVRLGHLEAASGNIEAKPVASSPSSSRRAPHRVVSAWGIAVLHASLGDVDEAFRWLGTAQCRRVVGVDHAAGPPRLIQSGTIRDIGHLCDESASRIDREMVTESDLIACATALVGEFRTNKDCVAGSVGAGNSYKKRRSLHRRLHRYRMQHGILCGARCCRGNVEGARVGDRAGSRRHCGGRDPAMRPLP